MLQFKSLTGQKVQTKHGIVSIGYDVNVGPAAGVFRRIAYAGSLPAPLLEEMRATFPAVADRFTPHCEPLLLPFIVPFGFDAPGLDVRLACAVKQTPGDHLSYAEQTFFDATTRLSANIGLVTQNSELSMTIDLGRGSTSGILHKLAGALGLDSALYSIKPIGRDSDSTIALCPHPDVVATVAEKMRALPADFFAEA